MKSGASDPFDEESKNSDGKHNASESSATTTQQNSDTEQGNRSPSSVQQSGRGEETTMPAEAGEFSRDQLPYILRREKVKDERPEVHQLFVQQETHSAAIDAERELEDRITESLSRTDAREAIYRVGMEHLDDAEEILRSWGYDL